MLKKYMYHEQELLPPKADIVFKAMFGKENNKDLLGGFLKDMLDLEISDGECLELLNTELIPDHGDGKMPRLDIRARLTTGENVEVEVQVEKEEGTVPRSVFYNDKLFVEQLKTGMDYHQLRKSLSLIIMDFKLFKKNENWYNRFKYRNVETGEELTDLHELAFLELPKWRALNRTTEEALRCPKEKWTLFLTTDEEEVLDMLAEKDKQIQDAIEALRIISADDKLKYEFDMRQKAELDHISRVASAARAEKLAEQRGMERGMERGLERGMAEGMERGMERGMELAKRVIRMDAKGVSAEDIAAECGIDRETVMEILR